jgi:hypothetical protein
MMSDKEAKRTLSLLRNDTYNERRQSHFVLSDLLKVVEYLDRRCTKLEKEVKNKVDKT